VEKREQGSRTPNAAVFEKKGSATRLADLKIGHYTEKKSAGIPTRIGTGESQRYRKAAARCSG
jgi:hypothetical protein